MSHRLFRPMAAALTVGIVYFGLVVFATSIQNLEFGGQVFWPGAGVTVAALLLTDRRWWAVILVAVAVAEIGWDIHNQNSVLVSSGFALANVAEPLFSVLTLRWLGKDRPDLRRPSELVTFLLVAGVFGPLLGGAIGGAVAVAGYGGAAFSIMIGWAIGDALGVLTVAPLLLVWRSRPLEKITGRRLEAAALALSIVVVGVLVLQPWPQRWAIGLPYLLAPFLTWAGLRFEVRGAAIAICAVALAENAATGAGMGVFAETLGKDSHIVLQIFLAVSAITALVLAAVASDLAERRAAELVLTRLALYDGLTGAANRGLLVDRLTKALDGIGRYGGTVGLVYADLDGFKEVNDTLGHHAGDLVLIEVTQRLMAVARQTDTVARLGGDEFAILLDRLSGPNDAAEMAQRVRSILAGTDRARPEMAAIAASVGFATTDLPEFTTAKLMELADSAMYTEKRTRTRVATVMSGPSASALSGDAEELQGS